MTIEQKRQRRSWTHLVGRISGVHEDAKSLPLVLATKNVSFNSTLLSVPKGKSLASDLTLSEGLELKLDLPFLVFVWCLSPD